MSTKKMLYTQEGYNELIEEVTYLKTIKREEVKEQIATARSFGDLSENSEYDEARNEQAKTEARIKELEDLIENAEIVDETKLDTSVVSLGSVIKVYDFEADEELEYIIVGSNQADPVNRKISDQSPIGQALMGAKANEERVINVPNGTIRLKVLEVTRTNKNA